MNRAVMLVVVLSGSVALAQDVEVADAGAPAEPTLAPPAPPTLSPEAPAKADSPTIKAAFGEGVTVQQGPFKLNVRGRVQVQGFAIVPGSDDAGVQRANGIVIRRARITMKGELPYELSFQLQFGFATQDLESDNPSILRDAFVDWRHWRDLSFRVGQAKIQSGLQRVISSGALQFVDRSVATLEFNLDRDIGLWLFSDDLFGLNGRLQYAVSVTSGDGRNRIGTNPGFMYTARLRYSPFGKFDEKWEGDPDRLDQVRLAVGGDVAYNAMTNRQKSTFGTVYQAATFNYLHAGGDVVFKWKGLSLTSEIFYRQADQDSKTNTVKGVPLTEYSRSGWGWFAQAGYFVFPWLELGARYGDARPFQDTDPAFHRVREIGGVVNFMPVKHDLKLQVDYFYLDNGHMQEIRHQVRAQVQVFF